MGGNPVYLKLWVKDEVSQLDWISLVFCPQKMKGDFPRGNGQLLAAIYEKKILKNGIINVLWMTQGSGHNEIGLSVSAWYSLLCSDNLYGFGQQKLAIERADVCTGRARWWYVCSGRQGSVPVWGMIPRLTAPPRQGCSASLPLVISYLCPPFSTLSCFYNKGKKIRHVGFFSLKRWHHAENDSPISLWPLAYFIHITFQIISVASLKDISCILQPAPCFIISWNKWVVKFLPFKIAPIGIYGPSKMTKVPH